MESNVGRRRLFSIRSSASGFPTLGWSTASDNRRGSGATPPYRYLTALSSRLRCPLGAYVRQQLRAGSERRPIETPIHTSRQYLLIVDTDPQPSGYGPVSHSSPRITHSPADFLPHRVNPARKWPKRSELPLPPLTLTTKRAYFHSQSLDFVFPSASALYSKTTATAFRRRKFGESL